MPASRCLWWLLTLCDGVDGVGIVALMAWQWCSLCISAVYCIRDLLDACAEALVFHIYSISERTASGKEASYLHLAWCLALLHAGRQ